MKNKLTLLLLAFCLAGSVAIAQKENRTVDIFTKLDFRTGGKLYLRQGSPQKVEIEGSKEDVSKITTEVEGGRLIIGNERKWNNWNWRSDIKIYITVANVESVSVSGSGDLVAQTKLTGTDFKANVSGSGSMEAEIEITGNMEARVSGSGNLEIQGKFKNFESDVSGSGDIALNAIVANDASFDLSGSGKVVAKGSSQRVKTTISGSGEVKASDFQTDSCDVRISGSGDVQISVKSSLDASISGSGSVSYRGDPSHVNSHSAGSGSVRKM